MNWRRRRWFEFSEVRGPSFELMTLGFQSHRRLHKRGCHKCGDKGLATAPHSKKHGPLGMLNLQRKTDEIRMIQSCILHEGT